MCSPFDERLIYKNPGAALSENTRGRVKYLPGDGYRTEYQRDIHRIIYSQSFRRLRHKTQVFFLPNNDHICTRLEHVLHVASASRTVARHLQVNEDLTEAIGLGHDLGHAPFGHHGEHVLKNLSVKYGLGLNFEHEVHGLRVVDRLAELDREPDAGLNLTFEVRDGIISHCGESYLLREIAPYTGAKNLESILNRKDAGMPVTLEGCIVRVVDKIAYAGRDVEDAIAAKLLKEEDIPQRVTSVLGVNNGEIVGRLLEDLIDYSKRNPGVIGFTEEKHEALKELIDFNYENIYLHKEVEKYKKQATRALEELFSRLCDDLDKTDRLKNRSDILPEAEVYSIFKKFIDKVKYEDSEPNEKIVLDFISGMTDNFVVRCLDQIFVPKGIT